MHNHCDKEVNEQNARKTLLIIVITLITMILEICYGYYTKSMALLSDGWHMGTHAFALFLTFAAYFFANKYDNSELFPDGTGKIPVLAGYTSSLFLALTGLWVIGESVKRLFIPEEISFNTAVLIAVIGLIVNGICLFIMESKHKDEDFNFKAAYLHILTDAMTSVFAIVALLAGKYLGLIFLDAVMGFVGGFLILRWSLDLIKDSSAVLLDMKKELCEHDLHGHKH